MAERAHPELDGYKSRFWGLVKNHYLKHLCMRYKFCDEYVKQKVVLDMPCGTGWGASLLKGAKQIFGVDVSQEAVSYGRKRFPRLRLAVGDCGDLPFRGEMFDVVICLEGLEHFEPTKAPQFLDEAHRVTKSDGLFIITCPILDDEGKSTGNPYHLKEYDHQELVGMLNDRFQILRLEKFKGPDGPEIKAVCRVIR